MEKILQIIKRKPISILAGSFGYLLIVGFLKWTMHPPIDALVFIAGGAMGVYFLDIAEVFFQLNPSPFRSVVFVGAFALVSIFVVTSSGSLLASGLVLSLFLTLLLWQIGEWQVRGNLNDWYRMVAGPVTENMQRWIVMGLILLFLIETFMFVR